MKQFIMIMIILIIIIIITKVYDLEIERIPLKLILIELVWINLPVVRRITLQYFQSHILQPWHFQHLLNYYQPTRHLPSQS